ncbi:unnamed protein product [Effrenium voratum]|nr:unnamed protein product [Effrenium voratum]
MQDRDVDIVLFNGGDIRGRKDYKAGPFTMGDLYNELAFHEPLAVVTMKGAQLAAAVKFSRAGTAEKPGFLHTDLDSEADKEHNLTKVNKRPFDAQKEYKVAVQRVMLTGMNNNTPLMEFGKANGVPSEELCRDAKEMVLVVCMKDMWRQVLGFGVWDSKSEGNVSPKKLREALIQAFEEMDKDKSGALDIKEIEQFLSKRLPNFASGSLATRLFQAADRDGNGKVNFEELANFVH